MSKRREGKASKKSPFLEKVIGVIAGAALALVVGMAAANAAVVYTHAHPEVLPIGGAVLVLAFVVWWKFRRKAKPDGANHGNRPLIVHNHYHYHGGRPRRRNRP